MVLTVGRHQLNSHVPETSYLGEMVQLGLEDASIADRAGERAQLQYEADVGEWPAAQQRLPGQSRGYLLLDFIVVVGRMGTGEHGSRVGLGLEQPRHHVGLIFVTGMGSCLLLGEAGEPLRQRAAFLRRLRRGDDQCTLCTQHLVRPQHEDTLRRPSAPFHHGHLRLGVADPFAQLLLGQPGLLAEVPEQQAEHLGRAFGLITGVHGLTSYVHHCPQLACDPGHGTCPAQS